MTHIYLNKQPPFPERDTWFFKKEQNYGTGLKRRLLSQTWVCLPDLQQNQSTDMGLGEGKDSVYGRAKQGEWVAHAQKTWTTWRLSGKGF